MILQELKHAGKTIKIVYDPETNPRTDYDNGVILAYWHPREVIGDIKIDHLTKEEIEAEYAEKGDPILAILPLYAYIHSGITVSAGFAFSCLWDSGQVGWAFITQSKSDLMGWGGWSAEKLEEAIRAEVKTYDDYLGNRVYGYDIEGLDGDHLASMGGFIGDMEYCISEAKAHAEECDDPATTRMAEELVARVTYASVV